MSSYPVDVVRTVDGDTMVIRPAAQTIDVTLGYGSVYEITVRPKSNRDDRKVRLAGLDCPELGTPEGVAAKLWVERWFATHPGPYVLTSDGDRTDGWDRIIGVIVCHDGHNLNAELLADGIAKVYRTRHAELAMFELAG